MKKLNFTLKNLQRICWIDQILGEGTIKIEHLREIFHNFDREILTTEFVTPKRFELNGDLDLSGWEKKLLIAALKKTNWNQKKAANHLGIEQRVINYKIKKHNIGHPKWRKNK